MFDQYFHLLDHWCCEIYILCVVRVSHIVVACTRVVTVSAVTVCFVMLV